MRRSCPSSTAACRQLGTTLRAVGSAALLLAAVAGTAPSARADTVTLNNGRTLEVDRAWYDGNQLRYEKDGATFGIPRSVVARVEQGTVKPPGPEVQRAKDALIAGHAPEAVRILTDAIAAGEQSPQALYLLVEAHLACGDPSAARAAAERGLKVRPQDPRLHALRGDALLAAGERLAAELAYRRSIQIKPDPALSRKLAELTPPAPSLPPIGAQLRIRYDGSVNEPLGELILAALGDAFSEYERRLGTSPGQPVTVVLQTGAEFQADMRNPEWAAGINDGTIRAPVGGLERVTPGLLKVLRHELAHSFVSTATGGNCPTWLQEGIAQWLEGADIARDDATVAAALREQRSISLPALDGGFRQLSAADATLAYAASHSAVEQILRTRGEPGLRRLLAALGDGLPPEEAFVVALAESYSEFHSAWTARLLAPASRTDPR